MADKHDYDVGYGKPPKASRFKPGQSGNPRGRPRGQPNLITDIMTEMAEQIRVREGERERSISKQRAMIKALVAKSLKGEARAAALLIGLITKLGEAQAAAVTDAAEVGADDQRIVEAFLARQLKAKPANTEGA